LRLQLLLLVTLIAAPTPAWAGPGDADAGRGRSLAKQGKCDEAIPFLEKAEAERTRPSSAVELGDCLVKKGELLRAREIYARVADNRRSFQWDFYDVKAWQRAKQRRDELDERIPTLTVVSEGAYEDLTVKVDGKAATLGEAIRVLPGRDVVITATAGDHERYEDTLQLGDGERREVSIVLTKATAEPALKPKPKKLKPKPKPEPEPAPEPSTYWLGARLQGLLLPQFAFNIFGDGGATVFIPGGGVTFTLDLGQPELVFALQYASYGLGETPFRPSDAPDTDWEIIESDLMALAATMDVMWTVPLAEQWAFRVGGSVGVGWAFIGDLSRTQAYPANGDPSDPNSYVKCSGPNDPAGTFKFCNQLDKDADHYDGYSEPNWFAGGSRPLLFPWIALPLLGLRYRPIDKLSLDLETGVSITGFMTNLGFRYGL
jgi:hypothetical protein